MNLKKDIDINKKVIISLVLICLVTITLGVSYALFQKTVKLDNVVEIKTNDKLNLDNSGLNFPSPLPNTVPIYTKDNKIYKADSDNLDKNNQWYDYRNKMIANAVTVKDDKEYLVDTKYENYINTQNYTILDDGNLYLDGMNDFYDLGYSDYDFNYNISIVARVKFHHISTSSQVLIGNSESAMGIKIIYLNEKIYFTIGNIVSAITTDKINIDTWYTIVVTYDGANLLIYINGIQTGKAAYSNDIQVSNLPFIIGGDVGLNGLPNQFCGNFTLSNIIIYTNTLTASEISTYFQGEITDYPQNNILTDVSAGKFVKNQKYYQINENNEIYFDGQNDFVALETHPEQFTNQISMIARVKFHQNGLNKAQEFFGNWESGGGGLACNSEDKIYFIYYIGDAYQSLVSNQKCEIETWYTIVGVYDGSYEHIYINGEEAGDPIAITGNIKNSLAPFALGINPKKIELGGGPVPGSGNVEVTVSDAFVYKDALTSAEVAKYFKDKIEAYPKDNLLIGFRGFKNTSNKDVYINIKAGTEIPTNDVVSNLEWIPRYSLIENKIRFERNTNSIETRDQAFSYNNKELLGYWVTKDNNIELGNLDVSKYNIHSITENEKSALTNLYSYWNKGESEGYTKSISVYGD